MSINCDGIEKKEKEYMQNPKRLINIVLLMVSLSFFQVQSQVKTKVIVEGAPDEKSKEAIETAAGNFLTNCNIAFHYKKDPDISTVAISPDAKKSFGELWTNTPFECRDAELERSLVEREFDHAYEIRNIPIDVEKDDHTVQNEECVLVFNENGEIQQVLFAIDSQKYAQMLAHPEDVKDLRLRQLILNFVENFRTAYNRKDINYLEDVFSDNALIIVGHVVQRTDVSSGQYLAGIENRKVEYEKKGKTEYIRDLRYAFKVNRFIKVQFDSIAIVKHPGFKSLYGVTLVQSWNSSRYSDVGYLFLMIDLENEDRPLIDVRTWQDQKYFTRDEVFKLSDFNIR